MAGKAKAKAPAKGKATKAGSKRKVAPKVAQLAQAKRPHGRQTVFTEEAATEICARLETGESLTSICDSPHIPALGTVCGWVTADRSGFAERYARARDVGLEKMADEIIEIADAAVGNPEEVAAAKLRVEARKWILSKRLPKTYGDKVEVGGSAENPLTLLIQEVQGRAFKPVQIVDGEAEEA